MINLATNIKSLREAMNMTQPVLAERVNVTRSTISAYENGTRLPSYEVLIKMASIFHVTTDNLLGFSNKYVIDVSRLNQRQRNTVQEIVNLYVKTNKDVIDLMESDSINNDMIALGYTNEFDIEEYKNKKDT